jgi:hypothetical protein
VEFDLSTPQHTMDRFGVELDLRNTPASQNGIPCRAATEGRPYSTFYVA